MTESFCNFFALCFLVIVSHMCCNTTKILKRFTDYVAKEEQWPWHCYIKNANYGDCSGVLITDDVVLTSAHCVVNRFGTALAPSELTVFVGIFNLLEHSGSRPLTVVRVQPHQNFSLTTLDFDIAILLLGEKINKNVTTPIEVSQQVPIDGTTCYSTGYGETEVSRESTKLRQVLTPFVSWNKCAPLVNQIGNTKLTKSMLCAGSTNGSTNACSGDSGGPLVCKKTSGGFELVGITSWGNNTECGEPSYSPGVYASLPAVFEWLNAAINFTLSSNNHNISSNGNVVF